MSPNTLADSSIKSNACCKAPCANEAAAASALIFTNSINSPRLVNLPPADSNCVIKPSKPLAKLRSFMLSSISLSKSILPIAVFMSSVKDLGSKP